MRAPIDAQAAASGSLATRRFRERVGRERPVDDLSGRVAQQAVVRPGVSPQELESGVDADMIALGDNAFGLLDQDARFQRALELGSDDERVVQGAFLENADRRDVGERLRDLLVFGAERYWS